MTSRSTSFAQSFGSTDIVKQGYLYVKRPPGNRWNKFKAWHKRFFVLRDSRAKQNAELAMYNSIQEARTNASLLNMYLRETVHIGIASESHRFSNVLVLVFKGRSPLLLAADDELTARSWMLALDLTSQKNNLCEGPLLNWSTVPFPRCSSQASTTVASGSIESDGSNCSCAPPFVKDTPVINSSVTPEKTQLNQSSSFLEDEEQDYNVGAVMERFPICFQMTEASEKVGLRDRMQLVVFNRGLGVARVGDMECFLLWPISVIRQYRLQSLHKSDCCKKKTSIKNRRTTVVTLEIGRRCRTGEGIFHFTTTQGEEIMRELKKALSNWASYKAENNFAMNNSRSSTAIKACCNHDTCRLMRFPGTEIRFQSAPCTPAMSSHSLHSSLNASLRPFEVSLKKRQNTVSEKTDSRKEQNRNQINNNVKSEQCIYEDCDYVEHSAYDCNSRTRISKSVSSNNIESKMQPEKSKMDANNVYIEVIPP